MNLSDLFNRSAAIPRTVQYHNLCTVSQLSIGERSAGYSAPPLRERLVHRFGCVIKLKRSIARAAGGTAFPLFCASCSHGLTGRGLAVSCFAAVLTSGPSPLTANG